MLARGYYERPNAPQTSPKCITNHLKKITTPKTKNGQKNVGNTGALKKLANFTHLTCAGHRLVRISKLGENVYWFFKEKSTDVTKHRSWSVYTRIEAPRSMCSVVEMVRRCSSSRFEWDWRECCVARPTARSPAAARAWARHGRRRCWPAASGQAVSIASSTPALRRGAPPASYVAVLFRSPWARPRLRNVPSAVRARFSLTADILSLVQRHGPRRVAPFRNGRIVCEHESGEDTATSPLREQGAAGDSDLAARRPSVTTSARTNHCSPCMNDSDGRDRKSESCLQFLRSARNLSRCPLSGGGARGAGSVLGLAVALTKRPSELWLGAYTPCTALHIPNIRAYLSIATCSEGCEYLPTQTKHFAHKSILGASHGQLLRSLWNFVRHICRGDVML